MCLIFSEKKFLEREREENFPWFKGFHAAKKKLRWGKIIFLFNPAQFLWFTISISFHTMAWVKNIAKISIGVGWLLEPYLRASHLVGLQCESSPAAVLYPSGLNIYLYIYIYICTKSIIIS